MSLPDNDNVDRVPANKVSKSRNGPSGTSVQHFVTSSSRQRVRMIAILDLVLAGIRQQ